ncbi:hypothetical protein TVAG_405830 [Trichomonas vaginalis G3]|uniref:Uncharacterized protein n=1 Tax=Trichomonas vaginalis (strain ATCC PRA-98 / G3) TaxID=412133 RepID=A2DV73_TRIV3|nr:hypothetical protein TVAGG3_0630950 [Trichomonas vaginalis G3]EAY15669.1 hypothetical protein TVAG_405830 [Trichomonas vaginalis G3]KAI5504516.1 hypothetical protein TVAGG3_0630950 [Trichomonas vaginalis G3]|eukprot:XP_001327892.1 hypothetical protein [Trichomonas vaginalis G3]
MDDESQLLASYTRKLLTIKANDYNIPVKYYPKIKEILIIMKKNAINDGQVEVVKSIHKALQYLDESKSAPTSPVRSSNRPKIILSLRNKSNSIQYAKPSENKSPEELSKDIENGERFNPHQADILPDIIQIQKEKIKKLIQQGKYEEASQEEQLRQYTSSIIEPKKKILKHLDTKNQLICKLEQRDVKLNEAKQKLKDDLQQNNDVKQKLIDEENKNFEREMEEFDRETEGEIPLNHRNYSPHYLNLKKQHDFLILCRRYSEAGKIKQICDAEEEKENIRIQSNWFTFRKNLRIKAEAEHLRRLRTIIDRKDITNEKIEQKVEYSQEATKKAMNLLNNQVNSIDKINFNLDPEPYHKQQPKPIHKQPYIPRECHLIRPNQIVWNTDKSAK